jgi:hypothetical protein
VDWWLGPGHFEGKVFTKLRCIRKLEIDPNRCIAFVGYLKRYEYGFSVAVAGSANIRSGSSLISTMRLANSLSYWLASPSVLGGS